MHAKAGIRLCSAILGCAVFASVPAALAAREDLVETRSRLAELLQWMGESIAA